MKKSLSIINDVLFLFFFSCVVHGQEVVDSVDLLIKKETVKEKKKTDVFNNGLIGVGNSTAGGSNINPQTNIRSLRYSFSPGKDTIKELYLVVRHSIANLSFELGKESNLQKVAIESIGSEIVNSYGGLFSLAIGDKDFQSFKNGNDRSFRWETGSKLVAYNQSIFRSSEEDKLSFLFVLNGFAEYNYSWSLKKDEKSNDSDSYIAINMLGGMTFSPIFNNENIYFDIFQDDRGNGAKIWGFTGSLGLELKLGKAIISIGALGRFPDSKIFGMHPRWYFTISND